MGSIFKENSSVFLIKVYQEFLSKVFLKNEKKEPFYTFNSKEIFEIFQHQITQSRGVE